MSFFPLKLAWKSLFTNKVRTILTVFGIVMGIAAVIIVMSAGDSLKSLVLGQLESYGNDILQIEVKVPNTGKNSFASSGTMAQGVQITTLTLNDAEAIAKLPNVKGYYALVTGQGVASYLEQNKTVTYLGVNAGFFDIDKTKLAAGRFFTDDEDRSLAREVVLGKKLADKFFGNQSPIGLGIKIGHSRFIVVGVAAERGGNFGIDFDNIIYVPLRTTQKSMLGIDYVIQVVPQVYDTTKINETVDEITMLLRERHHISSPTEDDFAITTMEEARDLINQVFGGITLLLVALATISLIVGGVGIMNIMYVSVTERTFEIGLRKSVGARMRQVLFQFLWEAIVMTVFGGAIGIVCGIIFTFLVSVIAQQLGFYWPFTLRPLAVLIAFGFCTLVGLIFGYYPARHAARLNPIEALRHE